MSAKHCATCPCATTTTGQVAAFITNCAPAANVTTAQVAAAIGYEGAYLDVILDKLAKASEIRRVRRGVYARVGLTVIRRDV
jgi:hypothetical protein